MPMKAMQAVASIAQGGVIFVSDVEPDAVQILDGFVVNSELAKCSFGEFTWYFALPQRPSESMADKAYQIVKAVNKR